MAKIRKTSVVEGAPAKEQEAPTNKYYLLVSDRYMRAKYVTIVALALFLAIFLILFKDSITYANLMYLFRDLNTGDAVYTACFDPIKYDEQENMCYGLYRDELAVIGNRSLKLYNSKGEENRSYDLGYSDPVIVSSDKYLLAYDIGTDSYSVFTSLTKVSDGKAEGGIEGAHVSDSGEYLLICRSSETKYVVYTFDSSFRPIAKYYKNRYVTSAAMGNDGSVVIASFNSDGGGYDCEVELYRDGDESPSEVYTAQGVFPVKCGMWDNGCYYVICTDRTLFFDSDGALVNSTENSFGYTSFAEGEKALALSVYSDVLGGDSEVFVFDTSGELLYNNKVSDSVSSLALSDNELFVLADTNVYLMPIEGGDVLTTDLSDGGDMIFSAGTSAVVCHRTGAEGVIFGDDTVETTAGITK